MFLLYFEQPRSEFYAREHLAERARLFYNVSGRFKGWVIRIVIILLGANSSLGMASHWPPTNPYESPDESIFELIR